MKFSKSNRQKLAGLILVVAALLFVTCSTNEVSDPLGINNFASAKLTSMSNSNGLEKTTFYTYETIYVTIEGLIPLEETHIEVVVGCPVCFNTIKRAVVVTDRDGRIVDLPIWQHVGVDQDGKRVDNSGIYCLHITQPPKTEPWTYTSECFDVVNDISPDAQIHATTEDGTFKGQASLVGEDVFATGYHVVADTVHLYVVPDKFEWVEGDLFTDVSGGFEIVKPTAGGAINPTLVWPAVPTTGGYDLVADVKPFGVFNLGDVISDPVVAGLVVQNAPGANDIVVDIACDETGNHLNTFSELDPLFGQVNPAVRSADLKTWMAVYTHWVPVYVMPHRSAWMTGEQLVTERTSGTDQMPSYVQINPISGAVALFRLRGENRPGFYRPLRLWPGDYDVIVDVNRNRKYDAGIDMLDGGPQVGFSITTDTSDKTPNVRLINTVDEDMTERGKDWTYMWAYLVHADNSPIPNIPIKFFIVRGPGMVEPKDGITDAYGMAMTKVSGLVYGQHTVTRTEAVVNDTLYYQTISYFRTPPCTHDQGEIGGF